MDDVAQVQCPYCFELLEVYVDPDTRGSFDQYCDVCCRPWQVFVERDEDGALWVQAARAQ